MDRNEALAGAVSDVDSASSIAETTNSNCLFGHPAVENNSDPDCMGGNKLAAAAACLAHPSVRSNFQPCLDSLETRIQHTFDFLLNFMSLQTLLPDWQITFSIFSGHFKNLFSAPEALL